MTLISLLICLGLQRYLQLNRYTFGREYFAHYYTFIKHKLPAATHTNGFVAISVILLPLLIVIALILTLTDQLLGPILYFILSTAILWYCLDGRNLTKEPYPNSNIDMLFTLTYHRVFAIIFWFAILGPMGLALYYCLVELQSTLAKQQTNSEKSLRDASWQLLGLLDWIPVRLLGITFGLVGHFNGVLNTWVSELRGGIQEASTQTIRYGEAALQQEVSSQEVIALLNRALLVWIVVIAMITIAVWMG